MPEIEQEKELRDRYTYTDMLKRFFREYLVENGRAYFPIQVAHIVGALLILVPPILLRDMLDIAIPEGNLTLVWQLVLLAFIVYTSSALIAGLKTYYGHVIAQLIVRDMRNDLYNHYQRLSMSFHDNKKTGELMSRIIDDLNKQQEYIHHGPEAILSSVTMLVGTLAIMITLSGRLTAVALIFVPFLFVFSRFLMVRMHEGFRETRERVAFMLDRLEDSLSGVQVIKVFSNEGFEDKRFSSTNQRHVDARMKAMRYMSILFGGSRFLNSFGILVVLSYGAILAINDVITPGTLVAFYGYMLQFRFPILQLVRTTEGLSEFFAAMERFFAHLDLRPSIQTKPDSIHKVNVAGDVEFDNVHFSYEEDDLVLEGINFHVEPNKTVALVGPSGAGKTTIVRLIPRLYDVDDGAVRVDGIDVQDWDLDDLRGSIGMVMQDEYLFSDSIAENIAYGKPDATHEEIVEAARLANAHEFIMGMPKGYDTLVGQRGLKLSGGQRQRVSIARAFLKNPRLLILDEATSSVDMETEKLIQEAIARITQGRTTFVIAHRLSTIVNANEILFVDQGQIMERGTHDELMKRDGKYRLFYDLQFRDQRAM